MQLAAIQTSLVGMGFPFFLSIRFISVNHSAVVSVMGTQTVLGINTGIFSLGGIERGQLLSAPEPAEFAIVISVHTIHGHTQGSSQKIFY